MQSLKIKRVDLMAADSEYSNVIKDNQRAQFIKYNKLVKDTEAAIIRQFQRVGYADVTWAGRGKTRVLNVTIPDGGLVSPDLAQVDKRHTNNQADYIADLKALFKDYIARHADDSDELHMKTMDWLKAIGLRSFEQFNHKALVSAASHFLADSTAQESMATKYEDDLDLRYLEAFTSATRSMAPLTWVKKGHGAIPAQMLPKGSEFTSLEANLSDDDSQIIQSEQAKIRAKYDKLIAFAVDRKQISSLKADQADEREALLAQFQLAAYWTEWHVKLDDVSQSWVMSDRTRENTVKRAQDGFKRHMEELALKNEFAPRKADKAARGEAYLWADMKTYREQGFVEQSTGMDETPYWFLVKTRQYWMFITTMNKAQGLGKSMADDAHDEYIKGEVEKAHSTYDQIDEALKMVAYPTFEDWIGCEVLDEWKNEQN